MSPNQPRLLILSCSQRKRNNPELLPAIERYNGPTFNLVRRYLKGTPTPAVNVQIISAQFGLIGGNDLIHNYDRRMTTERAGELTLQVMPELDRIMSRGAYSACCCCVGSAYLQLLHPDRLFSGLASGGSVNTITGSSGRRLSLLYQWLYGEQKAVPPCGDGAHRLHSVSIRGKQLTLSAAEVYDAARQALLAECGLSSNYQTWYVQIDSKKVSPKWLVSKLIGLPVGRFHSDDARRVLTILGIQIFSM